MVEGSVSETVFVSHPSGFASKIEIYSSSEMVSSIPLDADIHPLIDRQAARTLHRGCFVYSVCYLSKPRSLSPCSSF